MLAFRHPLRDRADDRRELGADRRVLVHRGGARRRVAPAAAGGSRSHSGRCYPLDPGQPAVLRRSRPHPSVARTPAGSVRSARYPRLPICRPRHCGTTWFSSASVGSGAMWAGAGAREAAVPGDRGPARAGRQIAGRGIETIHGNGAAPEVIAAANLGGRASSSGRHPGCVRGRTDRRAGASGQSGDRNHRARSFRRGGSIPGALRRRSDHHGRIGDRPPHGGARTRPSRPLPSPTRSLFGHEGDLGLGRQPAEYLVAVRKAAEALDDLDIAAPVTAQGTAAVGISRQRFE